MSHADLKLALTTQRLFRDDWVLGWLREFVERLSDRIDHLYVFPIYGESLPELENVTIQPLARDQDDSRARKLYRLESGFFDLVRNETLDGLIIHQNHLYAPALAWTKPFIDGPTMLYRAHGQLPWSIRLGIPFVDYVLTSDEQSFKYPTSKKRVLMQPVDLNLFEMTPPPEDQPFRIMSCGRISPIKGYEVLIEAVGRLTDRDVPDFEVAIYGEPMRPEDENYLQKLQSRVKELGLADRVSFNGTVPHVEMPEVFADTHLFVNSPVGDSALDKVVLESMAAGRPAVTSNPLFESYLRDISPELLFPEGDDEDLADRLEFWMTTSRNTREEVGEKLRSLVEQQFSLSAFTEEVLNFVKNHKRSA